MFFFYIIITALQRTALTKETFECKLSQHTGPQQCTGKLGEPLSFYLPTNTSEKKHLKKGNDTILNVANNKTVYINKEHSNWSASFTHREFQLNIATKMDSGDYQLQTFTSDGKLQHKFIFHIEILAPVSQPTVSQMCLSPEQMRVNCSSQGDKVEFTLVLDHNILIQTRTTSTDENHTPNVTINLHGQLTGNLTCTVQNNVSREDTVIQLTTCKGYEFFKTPMILANKKLNLWSSFFSLSLSEGGAQPSVPVYREGADSSGSISHHCLVTVATISTAATLLLILVLILGFKHLNKKKAPVTLDEDNAEDEVVYSDVRVKPTKETRPNTH